MRTTLPQSQRLALHGQLSAIPSLETGTTFTCRNPRNLHRVRALAALLAPVEALRTQEASNIAVLPWRLLIYNGQGP